MEIRREIYEGFGRRTSRRFATCRRCRRRHRPRVDLPSDQLGPRLAERVGSAYCDRHCVRSWSARAAREVQLVSSAVRFDVGRCAVGRMPRWHRRYDVDIHRNARFR
jgi:hypothetical protein